MKSKWQICPPLTTMLPRAPAQKKHVCLMIHTRALFSPHWDSGDRRFFPEVSRGRCTVLSSTQVRLRQFVEDVFFIYFVFLFPPHVPLFFNLKMIFKNLQIKLKKKKEHNAIMGSFQGSSGVKNLPAKQERWVRSLGWEHPLEKEMAIHSSNLAWKIPWTAEPSRLQSMVSQSRTRLND